MQVLPTGAANTTNSVPSIGW